MPVFSNSASLLPVLGQPMYNFGNTQRYLGWYQPSNKYIVATGGSVIRDGDYLVHIFTGSDIFQVIKKGRGIFNTLNYLLVAGGAGGGSSNYGSNCLSGGGGAGGLLTGSISPIVNSYSIIAGAAGPGGGGSGPGFNGSNTTAFGLTAIGGGGGGSPGSNGLNGGSGGGGANARIGGTGTLGQGYKGGDSLGISNNGAGGGGAASAGTDCVHNETFNVPGGAPFNSSISGSPINYAAGGPGNFPAPAKPSQIDGTFASGNGGAGFATNSFPARGGNGGSGVVIVRYYSPQTQYIVASGGTLIRDGNYLVRIFTGTDILNVTYAPNNAVLEYLLVAGGGGGTSFAGGGGGGGGLLHGGIIPIVQSYALNVGAGGIGAASNAGTGNSGSGTSAFGLTAIGGGYGGGSSSSDGAGNGGSGGGGGRGAVGFGTPGQGFSGGVGDPAANGGGGGGGAGISGSAAVVSDGGNGGNGLSVSITGASVYYAGGGAGAGSGDPSVGGLGGGGNGGFFPSTQAQSGSINTGGGGGGAYLTGSDGPAGNGGSGIVIVRYYSPPVNIWDFPQINYGYSIARKLNSAYSGPAIRVRRDSDDAEQDIGFVSNILDTAALQTFCGSASGFITLIYDQFDIAHFEQATTASQPKIVSSGTIITSNGKPAALFDTTSIMALQIGGITRNDDNWAAFSVNQRYSSGIASVTIYNPSVGVDYFTLHGNDDYYYTSGGVPAHYAQSNSTDAINDQSLLSSILNTSMIAQYKNGVVIPSTINTISWTGSVSNIGSSAQHGYFQEFLWFNTSNQAANQALIEQNIMNFYSIT